MSLSSKYYLNPLNEKETEELLGRLRSEDALNNVNEKTPCFNCGVVGAPASCERCGAKYCHVACQKSDWRRHRRHCLSKSIVKSAMDELKETIDPNEERSHIIVSPSGLNYLLYFNFYVDEDNPIPKNCIRANSELGLSILFLYLARMKDIAKTGQILQIIESKTVDILVRIDTYHLFWFQLTKEQQDSLNTVVF